MKATVVINAFKQNTTTIYDQRSLSIIDAQRNGEPKIITLHAKQYLDIFRKVLVPGANATAMDNAAIATFGFNLGWTHRTFTEVFPDNSNTIVLTLENMLTIPLQFSITALQFANYTYSLPVLPIPEDMHTVARGGITVQRLAIQPWTGYLFIATQAVSFLFVVVGGAVLTRHILRNDMKNLPELASLNMAGETVCYQMQKPDSVCGPRRRNFDLPDKERSESLESLALELRGMTSWQAANKLRSWRVQVAAEPSQ